MTETLKRIFTDSNGFPHSAEVHVSGLTPDSWVCGHCGKSLKSEKHLVGLTRGIRYCFGCANSGKMAKDSPDINSELSKQQLDKVLKRVKFQ